MADLRITQIRSTIGAKRDARESLRSLGLRRIHASVVREDTPAVRGYIATAMHLVTVETVTTDSKASDSR